MKTHTSRAVAPIMLVEWTALTSSRPWGLWVKTSTERLAETRNTQPVIASWLSRFARPAWAVIRAASTENRTAMAG